MCIICNCSETGADFLTAFENARLGMKKAKRLMLQCAKMDNTKEIKAKYDSAHKEMVRVLKLWNSIEMLRETHS